MRIDAALTHWPRVPFDLRDGELIFLAAAHTSKSPRAHDRILEPACMQI